jgi:peptidoglycan/LPS O-acetylase OafA/YrhL
VTVSVAEPAARPLSPVAAAGPRPRGDIQGLRAIAVLMVMLYHANVPFVRGGFAGVDVFFVISGFLITGLMVRELERTGTLSLRRFWARRARRLLPATALVLVVVTLACLLWLPQPRWAVTAGDTVAAGLYVLNWRLSWASLDYLAQDYTPSPVQHFWSLAVEEQFYLLWPVLVLALAGLGRRFALPLRRTLLAGVGLLALASLIWSIHLGGQPAAFFTTTTRGWELAIGAAVALLQPRLRRLDPVHARALTWAGLASVLVVAFWLPDSLPWPSWAALAPTLATAAVIAGGPAAGRAGASLVLDRGLLRWVGDRSYALYLWHWPFVVLGAVYWEPTGWAGLVLVALAVVPAYLSHRLVEAPIHRSSALAASTARSLWLAAACTLLAVAAGIGLRIAIPQVPAVSALDRPGAAALIHDPLTAVPGPEPRSISPDPLVARDDLPDLYARGCQSGYDDASARPCIFGDPAGSVTVALVGDSRAAQWSPALQAVAGQQHWRLITITKAGCPLADVEIAKGPAGQKRVYTSCREWNASAMRILQSGPDRPDLVVTTSYAPYVAAIGGRPLSGPASNAALIDGFHRSWAVLNEAGLPVVALHETPVMTRDVIECVADHRREPGRCSRARDAALIPAVMQPAAEGLPWTTTIDLTPALCPSTSCPPVIGNLLVYRDEHHLTAQYSRSLAPFLAAALAGLRERSFADGAPATVRPGGRGD